MINRMENLSAETEKTILQCPEENRLRTFFVNRNTADIGKWSNYFEIYETYFFRFCSRPIHFLEIGVDRGGSSQMWKSYFGKDSVIVGIDINPECKKFENPAEKRFIEIGDQSDPAFLQSILNKYGSFDMILDDGSHFFEHQIKSFEYLWNGLSSPGIYMVEDIHTSYYPSYNGWCKEENTFVEYAKNLVDEINSFHRVELGGKSGSFQDLYGMHCYSGAVVFEKKKSSMPYSFRSGKNSEKIPAAKVAEMRCAYTLQASFARVVSWYGKMIFGMISGNRKLSHCYQNQLRARKILKKRARL